VLLRTPCHLAEDDVLAVEGNGLAAKDDLVALDLGLRVLAGGRKVFGPEEPRVPWLLSRRSSGKGGSAWTPRVLVVYTGFASESDSIKGVGEKRRRLLRRQTLMRWEACAFQWQH